MKKLLLMLLIPMAMTAQVQVSILNEPINTAFKTKQNELNSSDHYAFRFAIVSNANLKVGINTEMMPESNFSAFNFDLGRRFFIGQNVEIIPALQFGFVDFIGSSFFSGGANTEIHFFITDHFALSIVGTVNQAKHLDLNKYSNNFSANVFVGITYKFNSLSDTRY